MGEPQPLDVNDAKSVYNAILQLLLQYPNYPTGFSATHKNVKWNNLGDGVSIGIFPLQGAIYLRRYVSGSYTAQFPFQICYKSHPTANGSQIDAQTLMDELSAWLEKCGIEFKDSNVSLEKITRTTSVLVFEQDNKETVYTVNLQLNYFYKKG